MVVLNDLATAVRKSGLPVVETQGWKSRGHGPFTVVETIVCHHTAGPSSGNMPSLGVVKDGRPGLSGPLCNLGLARDGTVYVVAAGIAWHAGVVRSSAYQNTHAIGIEAEATGTGPWSSVQMDAYAKLCRALCDHYGIPVSRVLGHKEVCSPPGRKIDPNFDMGAFRKRVENATAKPLEEPDMEPKQIAGAPVTLTEPDGKKLETTIQGALDDTRDRVLAGNKRLRTIDAQLSDISAQLDKVIAALGKEAGQ